MTKFSIYDGKYFEAYELFLNLKFVIITRKIKLLKQLQPGIFNIHKGTYD